MKGYKYSLSLLSLLYLLANYGKGMENAMKFPDMKGLDDLSALNDVQIKDIFGLTGDEVKERLTKLFGVIDKNQDKVLSDEEISAWFEYVKNEVFLKQVQIEMKQIDADKDGFISLPELNDAFSQNLDPKEVEKHADGLLKRFQIVDKDKDNKLNLNEVGLLIDPMKDNDLKELEINEILEHHDTNKDGKISVDEFKETRSDDPNMKKDDELALDDFNFFDVNKDGFIDREEIVKVYFDPSNDAATLNLNDVKNNIFEGKPITFDLWNEKSLKFAVTSLTDYGDVIRYPQDFKLDIGKNVVLPSSKHRMGDDILNLDTDLSDGKDKEDESGDASDKQNITDEL
ncbi:endoplasmic reticulum-resident calcium binding protein, putative [Plasmodium chabaudi chabaudi]|uniref:non-specific serine/threonine protein kinase n=1 Tax=Plasmodium chabaudi chabaudi TaxID=31271 RepID=A0A1D3RV72_PLACU|nr:endoplasmic reticulum-resident calcium binding protein, putative [Plasmodium chabaudi chabaudi]